MTEKLLNPSRRRRALAGAGCLACAVPMGVEGALIGHQFTKNFILGDGFLSLGVDPGVEITNNTFGGSPFLSAVAGFAGAIDTAFGNQAFRYTAAATQSVTAGFVGVRRYVFPNTGGGQTIGVVAGNNNFIPFRLGLTGNEGSAWGFIQYDYGSGAGTIFYSTTASPGSGSVILDTSVPEPSSFGLGMLALGAAGIVASRRRKQNSNTAKG